MATSGSRRPGRPAGGQLVVDRERVLDAAERVIAREGAGVSIDDIALEAGVTKPIVYDRVGSRSELADALAERLADRMVKAAGDTLLDGSISEAGLARFIEANLVTVSRHRELFLYVTGGSTEQTALGRLKVAERSIDPMTVAIRAWRHHFDADPEVADTWAAAIVGALQMVAIWWTAQSDRTAHDVARQLADLLWNGLPGRSEHR
jgi:AcrR family transcriptional regulator